MFVDTAVVAVDIEDTSPAIHRLSVVRGRIGAFCPQPQRPKTPACKQLSTRSTDAKTTDDKHYLEMNNLKSTHLPHSGD